MCSMGRSTNETLNVWTHVIGAALFIYLLFLTYRLPTSPIALSQSSTHVYVPFGAVIHEEVDNYMNGSPHVPRWPITVFVLCAIRCLGGSAIFHNFLCVSKKVKDVLQTLDYTGICILICGSYVPVIYYSFFCYQTYLWTTWSSSLPSMCSPCVFWRHLLSGAVDALASFADSPSTALSVRSASPASPATPWSR